MKSEVRINNRRVAVTTALSREDYCRTAMLFYVLDGNVAFVCDNQTVELKKNDILAINRGTEYTYRGSGALMLASLELMGKTFESACDGVRFAVRCCSSTEQNEHYTQLRGLLRQMMLNQLYVEEDAEKYSYLVFEYYSLYYRLLETIVAYFVEGSVRAGTPREIEDKNPERREEIERYLNIHYREPISLEDISNELFISKGYLSKYFIRSFGINFSQYLKELRLRHAMSDLLYTDNPITQITYDNGFSGSSFFNKAFREKFGKNPSEARREFLEKSGPKQRTEDEKDLYARLGRMLDADAGPAAVIEPKEKFVFSAAKNTPVGHCWNSMINIGSASDMLGTDIQAHIMILSRYVKYARFWDPFSEEMLLDVNNAQGNYNFLKLDQVFDTLIDNGMKPFVVFEPKLQRINESVDSVIIKARHETRIQDVASWKNIFGGFFRHVVRKYGIEEVEQWKFELPYGVYQLDGMDPAESYQALFKVMFDTVREYTYQLMLGGPTLQSSESQVLRRILCGLEKMDCLPDFVSMISFAYEVNDRIHKYSIRSVDEDYLLRDVETYRTALEACGFPGLPLYVTEWNETVADRNFVNDSCYRGAYMVKSLLEINQYVPVIGYFSGTDLRSEYFDSHSLLQGGNGIISRDGIFKPAGFALELLNGLAGYQIGAGKQFLITTDRRNNYYVVAHNKRKLSYYYFKTAENRIEKEKMNKYCEDENYLEQEIELTDVKNGEYRVRTHVVNPHYGSVLNLWKDLNYSDNLSRKDITYLKKICEPHLLFYNINVTDNRLPLKIVMEPNEITLIEIIRTI